MNKSMLDKASSIGKVVGIDLEGLSNWRLNYGHATFELKKDYGFDEKREQFKGTDLDTYYFTSSNISIVESYSYPFGSLCRASEDEVRKHFESFVEKKLSTLQSALAYATRFNNPIQVYFSDDKFVIIGWGETRTLVPAEFVSIELYKSYDDVLPYEIPSLITGEVGTPINGLILPDGTEIKNSSKRELRNDLEAVKTSIQAQEEELKKGLEELRQELRKREEELRLQMQAKMSELEAKKKEFEIQLFGLDHQIYLLRCLLGDSIQIAHLRKGQAAPSEQPVVLYQKLRFLDEDLAKIKSLYCHDYDDEGYVEEIFATDDFVFEQFCPNTKCVSLFRISKDNTHYAKGDGNCLEKLAYYNGKRIGLLVRNGENLYLVWTEQDRVYLRENFVYSGTGEREVDENSVVDKTETITDMDYTDKRNIPWVQFFSRKFLMAILQGLVEYKKVFTFPETVSFATPNPYVIFSTADNQITDHRFGSLSDFMRCRNPLTKVGDMVLPTMSIQGSVTERGYGWGNPYHENHERGRGDKNRVRDCVIDDEVQPINFIEIPSRVSYLSSKADPDTNPEAFSEYNEIYSLMFDKLGNCVKERLKVGNVVYSVQWRDAGVNYVWKSTQTRFEFSGCIKREEFFTDKINEYEYYISVEKPEGWNSKRKEDSNVRSNVQIYRDEFINLTYLCSSVLKHFMETKQIGDYFGTNYAYAIKYLHKALEYIRSREKNDFIQISAHLCKDVSAMPHIDLILMDWKFNNKVREITDRQAKRFAKYLSKIEDFDKKAQDILSNLDWVKREI